MGRINHHGKIEGIHCLAAYISARVSRSFAPIGYGLCRMRKRGVAALFLVGAGPTKVLNQEHFQPPRRCIEVVSIVCFNLGGLFLCEVLWRKRVKNPGTWQKNSGSAFTSA